MVEMNDLQCLICYQPYDTSSHLPKLLSCMHTFCSKCLTDWSQHGTCPTCRAHFVLSDVPTNETILALIQGHASTAPQKPPAAQPCAAGGVLDMWLMPLNSIKCIPIKVDTTKDVAYLKRMVAEITGVPIRKIILYLEGGPFINGDRLANYELRTGGIITLLRKFKGGD